MSARDVIVNGTVTADGRIFADINDILSALKAAGYRIVPPGGLDAETVERCIGALATLRPKRYSDGSSGGWVDEPPSQKEYIAALRSLIEEPDAIVQRNGGKT